ncbi:hypothetical protein JXA48_00450 [Candidatus Woesearchaeota archaeon]|nr:hypothetical protein [Candidatus Woesearchaeota archaeon]
MTDKELDTVTKEVRRLLLKGKEIDEIRDLLRKQKYSHAIISGALVQSQVKKANRRLARRKTTTRIVNHGSNFNLIILFALIIYVFASKGNVGNSIITSTIILTKLFSLSMIINSMTQLELRWTAALIVTFFVPGLDIIGAGWYYLIIKLRKNSMQNQ